MDAANNENLTTKAYSFEAEQAVLGCVLMHPEAFSTVAMQVKAEYFFYPQHRAIYEIMQQLDATAGTVDILMVLEHLKNEKLFSGDEGGKKYLYQLAESVPSTANLDKYCGILRDKFYIRTLVSVSNQIIEEAENADVGADRLLDNAEQSIYAIRQGQTTSGPSKLSEVITTVYDTLNKLNSDEKEMYKGLETGFSDFDRMSTGLHKSDLVVIGARPAMGKTSFALNMACNVAKKLKDKGTDKKVVFFSLEMSKEQLAQRVISMQAQIPSQKLRSGELAPEDWPLLSAACMDLVDYQLYFDDTANITVPEMKARLRRMKGVAAVFIDYLQLMSSPKKIENRVQEVSDITRNLKLMAKDLMVPVVVCAQLSRGTEGRGGSHKPQLADLRESGSIEQDADIVVMLYREDYYKSEKREDGDDPEKIQVNTAQLLVQKNRHGPVGVVDMAFNPKFTLFTGIDKTHDDEG